MLVGLSLMAVIVAADAADDSNRVRQDRIGAAVRKPMLAAGPVDAVTGFS